NSGEQLITSALEYPREGMAVKLEGTEPKSDETQLALQQDTP
ncbi:efflux RND transporter periplasmic adaptor subunit, partial [Pseudoalteromonas sp. S1731]